MIPKLINKNRRDENNNPEEKKKKPLIERKGDWLCPKCRNLNFAFRLICNRCQLAKSEAENMISFQQNILINNNLMGKRFGYNQQQNPQNNNNNVFIFQDYQNMNLYNNLYGIHGNNINNINNNIINQNMLNYLKMNTNQRQIINPINQINFTNFTPQINNNNVKKNENINHQMNNQNVDDNSEEEEEFGNDY